MQQLKKFLIFKNVLYKSKIDLYCLKIFEKIEDKFRKNCVSVAEALSDFREK